MSLDITSYDNLEKRFRYHWEEGRKQAREANECINGMVLILHEQNPEWSINKIAEKIANDNQDLPGFSKRNIFYELNEDNRALIDETKKPKSHKSNVATLQHSETVKKLTELIETLKKDIETRDKALIDLQQKINKMEQDQQQKSKTIEINKANSTAEKYLQLEKELEAQKKLTFSKDQRNQELEIKLEKLTDQIEKLMKQQKTEPVPEQPSKTQNENVISREGIYILGEKSIPSIFKEFKSGKNIGIPDQSKINPQRLQQLEQLATKMVN